MLQRIPDDITDFCEQKLGRLLSFTPASGGCINHGGSIDTANGTFFIKWNTTLNHEGMFTAEQHGLDLLAATNTLHIPKTFAVYEGNLHSCIVMEYVAPSIFSSGYNEILGHGLAQLHKTKGNYFGLDHDNYMGSLVQQNEQRNSWIEVFRDCRLVPQLDLARQNSRMDAAILKNFDRLMDKLPALLIAEPPTLVHGDLWRGNVIVNHVGLPCLIDPAVAYAHREVDLAMTKLFGGFDRQFYTAYQEEFPTEPDLDERIDIYLLYPLLVHVNLFGDSYLHQTRGIVDRFV